jgi:hypothetical protein
MKVLLLFLSIITAGSIFGQKPNGTKTSGLLLLEEFQGVVYESYFLPNFESQLFKHGNRIDTVNGFAVQFIYGCVPNNNELRNDLRKMRALDSVQAISAVVNSRGQEFFDSSTIFFAKGTFLKSDLTDHGQTIRFQQFQVNGRTIVVAIKGECTSRTFSTSKGKVSS